MADLLIIEDNIELAAILCDFLARDGYSFFHAKSGEEGLTYFNKNEVKLVLLDLMLPGLDGFQICKIIREKGNIPIMITSARVDKTGKLEGLTLGADDYIEKPFDLDILLAKIKAHLRRSYEMKEQKSFITDGDIKIDMESNMAYFKGEQMPLTIKEFELLYTFLQNKGKTLKKEWMFDKIWGIDSFSEPSTLTVHINKLREKIEESPKKPTRIVTVWGVGYRYEGF